MRPTGGRYGCRLGGDLIGSDCHSLKDACAWIDYVLPLPAPVALQAALCASRQAARDAIRHGGGDKARTAKAFGQAAAQPLEALKAMGLDDTGETQLIRALFAGQTIALKMPGYGAAFA